MIDGIRLEVLKNHLFGIAEEMGTTLVRTAYSTNIKDRRDCSCAIFSASGETVAQAEHIPIHLGVLPWGVRGALERIDKATLRPGDVFMHNDPYIGGTHIPDVIMFAPVFVAGELICFVGNVAHHVDMGGQVPGSQPPRAKNIFQEGLRFPTVRLQAAGVLDEYIMAIHDANVRTPYEGRGDLMAQIAAINVGTRRIAELVEEIGAAGFFELTELLDRYCERRVSAELATLPTGSWSFTDHLEFEGLRREDLLIRVTVEIEDGRMKVDFTGSSPQVEAPLNAVRPMALACVYYVLKTLTDPSIPLNQGTFRPLDVITPEGSIVNARFPAATGHANSTTCQRIVDVLLGALAPAVPEKISAAATGSMNTVQIGGARQDRSMFTYVETYGGGYGGGLHQDGASGVQTHMTNTRNAPVEVLEAELPVLIEGYGLRPDSEGPGRHRGGFGLTRIIRVLADNLECVVSTDRVRIGPWGLEGGLNAATAEIVVQRADGGEMVMDSKGHTMLMKDDRLIIRTSGGGGYGEPTERDRAAVIEDVVAELVSPDRARSLYGQSDVTP
jgi:N-methylhydantoinase B